MAKFSATNIKDLLEIHENTLIKLFNDKFDKMEIKFNNIQEENKNFKNEMKELRKAVDFVSEKYETTLAELKELKKKNAIPNVELTDNIKFNDKNNDVKDKLAELEDRSRRNNLRFNGVEESENESWKDCERKIQEVLKSKFGFTNDLEIERAHRIGRNEKGVKKNKTIIVKFLNYKERNAVFEIFIKLKLWNEKLNVNVDFSERTTEIRKKLFKEAKELRAKGKFAKVIYNKLITRDF
ncbi:uncharacterized protein LOC136075869 [Hydra vulgaris]|uniref:Uncharacterized protein LOC136075869 n=1 Tax=Hydra vulgaris TaxID=6087 RepID=A0ABM4B922_HYDVU